MASPHRPTPVVSRAYPDGRLIELLYDPRSRKTRLAECRSGSEVGVHDRLELEGDVLAPYAPTNNLIATGCVLLPSSPEEFGDKAALLQEIRSYLRRYVDLSPLFEGIAAHYALLTWVYDAFHELPYLRFRGDYGTGKTRALLTLGSICYKPFFASGASTVSPIFHVLDAFGGTLVLDEADFRFTDATAALTKILNNGNVAGLPVLRSVPNRHKEYDPKAFRVFGPKLIGMRERFSDAALESRFLTEETGQRSLRSDIPIQVPATLGEEALILRNKLLMWRFRERGNVAVDPTRAAKGVEPRLNQTSLALLSLVDDPSLRADIKAALVDEQDRLKADRSASLEALVLSILIKVRPPAGTAEPSVAMLAEHLQSQASAELGRLATPKWTGWFLRARLRLSTLKRHGVYVLPHGEWAKVAALALRYGVDAVAETAMSDIRQRAT